MYESIKLLPSDDRFAHKFISTCMSYGFAYLVTYGASTTNPGEDVEMKDTTSDGNNDQDEYDVLIRCTNGADISFSSRVSIVSVSYSYTTLGSILCILCGDGILFRRIIVLLEIIAHNLLKTFTSFLLYH